MNITTENIDEWCFRYLEKDLNENELDFFENELERNPVLSKQVSLWQKTIVQPDLLKQLDCSVPNNLFRYNNQILFVLIEFVLVSSLSLLLLLNTTKQSASKESSDTTNSISSSSRIYHKDSAAADQGSLNKSSYPNLIMKDINDSVEVFQNETKRIGLDTVTTSTDVILPFSKEVNQTDSITTSTDLTIVQNKSTHKKSATKRKYRGSRLIPINNDL